ncbi:hypothetical protein JCM16303_004326 [Sporobolomyces ruberrimus]
MLSRQCSTSIRHAPTIRSAELAAALAQLPSFLVPSFAQSSPDPRPSARRRSLSMSKASNPPSSRHLSTPRPSSRLPSSYPSYPPQRNRHYSTAAARPIQSWQYEQRGGEANEGAASEAVLDRKGKGKEVNRAEGTENGTDNVSREMGTLVEEGVERKTSSNHDPKLRSQLMQLLSALPPKPTRGQLLEVKAQIEAHGRLHDPQLLKRLVSIAIEQKFHSFALRTLNQSINFMLSRRTETKRHMAWIFVDVVQHLGRLKRWEHVVDVTNQALHKGLVSAPLLHSRMRGLNKRSRYVDTIETFGLYEKHGFAVNGPAYDEVIEAHLLNSDLPRAQALLAEKGEKGFPTTAQTCLSLFDGMALYGGNKVMEEKVLDDAGEGDLELRSAVRQDVKVLNKIMSVRAGRGAARDALAMLDYYDLSRYPPELFTRFRQLALPLPDAYPPPQLDHWRPSPDASTLVCLSGIALRYRRPDLASDLLSSTTGRSHRLNEHLVAAIVRILITEGSISAAEEFVFALPSGQARFRDFTYRALEPSSFVYETLLTGILRFRGLAGVDECFRRLTEAKLPPLKVTEGLTRALVDYLALEKMEKLGVSAKLLIKVKEITSGRTQPSRDNLDTLLKAAWMSERLSVNDWTRIRKAVENEFPIPRQHEGKSPPPRPRPEIANLLARDKFTSKASARRINSIARLRDSFIDRNIRHGPKTAVHVLRNDHLIRFISAKWDYLQSQVLDLGVRPTYDHFTVLIRAYLLMGDVKGAVLALRYALSEAKIEPHVALYSVMISGLSRLGRPDHALAMYQELRATPGLEPDRLLFAALAMSCSRMRDLEGLERILEEVKDLVNNPVAGRNIDPALLAQADAQSKARRAKELEESDSTARKEEDVAYPAPLRYDPLLDPFFLTIYYRTLNLLGRHFDAQIVMKSSLDRGLVPDRIVWEVLDRTGTWFRWKDHKEARDHKEVDRSKTKLIWEKNFRRVRDLTKEAVRKVRRRELRVIQTYWEKAEEAEEGDLDESEWRQFLEDTSTRSSKKEGNYCSL